MHKKTLHLILDRSKGSDPHVLTCTMRRVRTGLLRQNTNELKYVLHLKLDSYRQKGVTIAIPFPPSSTPPQILPEIQRYTAPPRPPDTARATPSYITARISRAA